MEKSKVVAEKENKILKTVPRINEKTIKEEINTENIPNFYRITVPEGKASVVVYRILV